MQKKENNFIKGSREEEKRMSFVNIKGEKYRLIYSKSYGNSLTKDILKIEISSNFLEIVPYVHEVYRMFKRIHLFVKYKEYLKLEEVIEEIDEKLVCGGYNVNFVFIPKEYEGEEYILVYDIMRIETKQAKFMQ